MNFDLVSSSVTSIEGYNYCAVFTDDCSEYRWAYGLKTKDELIDAVKQWYAEIAASSGKISAGCCHERLCR